MIELNFLMRGRTFAIRILFLQLLCYWKHNYFCIFLLRSQKIMAEGKLPIHGLLLLVLNLDEVIMRFILLNMYPFKYVLSQLIILIILNSNIVIFNHLFHIYHFQLSLFSVLHPPFEICCYNFI